MTTVHVGAIPVTEVVCPRWCVVPQAEHLADLPNWEGRSLHWSADVTGGGWSVRHSRDAFANGVIEPSHPPLVFVNILAEALTPAAAVALAEALVAVVKESRA
jgi:hypothetical protein